jgi:hypothetical protein
MIDQAASKMHACTNAISEQSRKKTKLNANLKNELLEYIQLEIEYNYLNKIVYIQRKLKILELASLLNSIKFLCLFFVGN